MILPTRSPVTGDARRPLRTTCQKWVWTLLALILALGAYLRFHNLGARNLWTDEMLTLASVSGSDNALESMPIGRWIDAACPVGTADENGGWHELFSSLHYHPHPPLYYLLEWLLRPVLGPSDAAFRGLSAMASLLSILLLFLVCRELHSPPVALGAALIMALGWTQIYFAQEARSYSMLVCLALATSLAVVRLEKRGPSRLRCLALGLCALALLLTHYSAGGVLIALGVYAMIRLRGLPRRQAAGAILGAVLLFALLWTPLLLRQVPAIHASGLWRRDEAAGHLLQTLTRAASIPLLHLSLPLPTMTRLIRLGAVLYVLPLLLLRRRGDLLLWCMWAWAAVGQILFFDLWSGQLTAELLRYSMLATPAFIACYAALLCDRRIWCWALPASAIAACLMALPDADGFSCPQFAKPRYQDLGQYVCIHSRPGDVFVFAEPRPKGNLPVDMPWQVRMLYAEVSHYANGGHGLGGPVLLVEGCVPPEALLRLHGGQRIWLIADPLITCPLKVLPGTVPVDTRNSMCSKAGRVWLVSMPAPTEVAVSPEVSKSPSP